MCLKAGMGNSMVPVTGCGPLTSQHSTCIIWYLLLTCKLHWPKVSLFFICHSGKFLAALLLVLRYLQCLGGIESLFFLL